MEKIRYDSIFNNGHTPMLIIDSDTGEIRECNQAACNYYGYTRDQFLALKITDINTLSRQEVFEEMKKASKEDRKFFRFRHRLSGGGIKEVEVYSGPIHTDSGTLLFSIIHDIEDKKKMELIIRHQQSNFQSLYENSPEAIAMLDNEFKVISVNSSFERIFQYRSEEIRGRNITKVLCEKKSYDESSYIKDCIKRGEFVRKETLRRRKDGKLINVSFLGYPIMSEGEQLGVYGIYSDISSIKEEKLEQEKKIRMYIKQLKAAKLRAEEASKFKTQFIASMTHELRTPVNGITGIIELMGETMLSEEQQEYFQLLRYSADRLSSVINDVLDISKIEAGKLELRTVRFNVKQLIDNVARYYKLQAGRKGLELNSLVDPDIPDFLLGDSDKLNQVLFNLLSNAVKFTEAGHIDIEAKMVAKAAHKASINFRISDTGIGIPKEKTGHIFEDFYQLETAKNRKYGGTGLGLSISKKLVNLMGGDIMVESECNKGCTFSFEVEFQSYDTRDDPAINGEADRKAGQGVLPALNILVVEDDGVNQKVLKGFLEKSKCNVTMAESGKEALKILEKRSFDVILIDIYMPDMNGYETALRLRKREAVKGGYTPVIAITAAVQEADREEYLRAGIECCIAKPFGRDQLYGAIAGVLRNRHNSAAVCLKSLIERFEGDYVLLDDIIKEVISSKYQKEFFGGIEKYIGENNPEKLCRHVHKFKGSISHFQAEAIDNVLSEIMESCRNQDLSQVEKLSERLKREYIRFKECLTAYLEEKGKRASD